MVKKGGPHTRVWPQGGLTLAFYQQEEGNGSNDHNKESYSSKRFDAALREKRRDLQNVIEEVTESVGK